MNASPDLERRLAAHLAAEAPSRAPDWVLATALETIDTVPQRRVVVRVPWRVPHMSMYAKLAAAAVTVVALGALGLAVLTGGGTPDSPESPPSPTAVPSPSSSSSPLPALTGSYTSAIHGISVGYPASWIPRPATEPWAAGELTLDASFADAIETTRGNYPAIVLASQPIGDRTADEWTAGFLAARPCGPTSPQVVGGSRGVITECGNSMHAIVVVDGRAHVIWLYDIEDPDRIREILATVRFRPTAADFSPPFSHQLPSGVVFDLGPDYGPAYFGVRIPAAAEAGTPSGLIVQAIGGGRADPCADPSPPVAIAAGPQAVIDHLRAIPELSVTGVSETTVSGLPAVEATVTMTPSATCPQLWPWVESPEPMPDGTPLRIIAVDVGGEHLVLTVYGETANPAWDAMADELIGSIRFETP